MRDEEVQNTVLADQVQSLRYGIVFCKDRRKEEMYERICESV